MANAFNRNEKESAKHAKRLYEKVVVPLDAAFKKQNSSLDWVNLKDKNTTDKPKLFLESLQDKLVKIDIEELEIFNNIHDQLRDLITKLEQAVENKTDEVSLYQQHEAIKTQ